MLQHHIEMPKDAPCLSVGMALLLLQWEMPSGAGWPVMAQPRDLWGRDGSSHRCRHLAMRRSPDLRIVCKCQLL